MKYYSERNINITSDTFVMERQYFRNINNEKVNYFLAKLVQYWKRNTAEILENFWIHLVSIGQAITNTSNVGKKVFYMEEPLYSNYLQFRSNIDIFEWLKRKYIWRL